MSDILIDYDKLSLVAKDTIDLLDEYISIIERRTGNRPAKLNLHWRVWDDLDKSIRYTSRSFNKQQSLRDLTFKGVRIIRDVDSWDEDE